MSKLKATAPHGGADRDRTMFGRKTRECRRVMDRANDWFLQFRGGWRLRLRGCWSRPRGEGAAGSSRSARRPLSVAGPLERKTTKAELAAPQREARRREELSRRRKLAASAFPA